VIDRFKNTPDPRLKTIMNSLVRHLHDFVRDVDLTTDEWNFAINYLTRTGHMCSDVRQEFILLSDTLGISMLVDAVNHRMPAGATQTTVLGPFYVENPPEFPLAEDVAREVGVSKHTIYAWKAKYGGMDVSQAQEAKQLRDENTRLRKLVADLNLDKEALQSVIRKNGWSS
jgi:hypothetical protein